MNDEDSKKVDAALRTIDKSRKKMNLLPYDSPERKRLHEEGMKAIYGGAENWRELHKKHMEENFGQK